MEDACARGVGVWPAATRDVPRPRAARSRPDGTGSFFRTRAALASASAAPASLFAPASPPTAASRGLGTNPAAAAGPFGLGLSRSGGRAPTCGPRPRRAFGQGSRVGRPRGSARGKAPSDPRGERVARVGRRRRRIHRARGGRGSLRRPGKTGAATQRRAGERWGAEEPRENRVAAGKERAASRAAREEADAPEGRKRGRGVAGGRNVKSGAEGAGGQ